MATATFRIIYGFVVLEHSTRRIIHFNVTATPSAQWAAIQVAQAFPTGHRATLHRKIVAIPVLGGLHRRYERVAA